MSDTPDKERTPRSTTRTFPIAPSQVLPPAILPSARELAALEKVKPGITDILMAEYQATLNYERQRDKRAQWLGFWVAIVGMFTALGGLALGAFTGHWPASVGGGIIGVLDLVALVRLFLPRLSDGDNDRE